MPTLEQLRSQLAADAGLAPDEPDRLAGVRRRIVSHRRRRAAGVGVALVAVVSVVGAVLPDRGPQAQDELPTTPRPPGNVRPAPAAVVPLPVYHLGGKLLVEDDRTGPTAFTVPFTPHTRRLFFTLDCYVPSGHAGEPVTVELSIGGTPVAEASCAHLVHFDGENVYTPLARTLRSVVPGAKTSLGLSFDRDVSKVSRIRVGVYEQVAVEDYVFPVAPKSRPRLELTATIDPGRYTHPVALVSAGPLGDLVRGVDVVGARGTWSQSVTLRTGLAFEAVTVAPGEIRILIDGHEVAHFIGWDYSDSGYSYYARPSDLGRHVGDSVTVTIVAERFNSPSWAVLVANKDLCGLRHFVVCD